MRPARFYFSFRSPYSWLAYRELVARHQDVCARLSWVPFWEPDERFRAALRELGSDFSYVDMSAAKARYILQDVRRLVTKRGARLAWPVDRQPWWEVPHLAYLVAARQGRGPQFIERVYRARWEEGRDIHVPETIAGIAGELGLDPDEHARAAGDPAVRAEALRVLLAIHDDGVFGVPFFVHGWEKFWGLDRLDAFLAALDGLRKEPPAGGKLIVEPAADQGHAGGCG
ncbi:MAG TPA: DsbA family protein [Micromonosporaceae bacterium]|nr:DsbA family protein [Micromonosporaceae bacterium]